MCKCDKLKNIPIGQKRKMVIERDENFRGIKSCETAIIVDNYADKVDIFLKHLTVLDNGMNYGTVVDITNCPFCGRNLAEID